MWLEKHKAILLYLFFGGCTMVINTLSYAFCYEWLHISNVVSTVIAWFLAVVVAYITNKIWVFESKTENIKELFREIWKFFSCRIGTGIVDVLLMYVCVDLLCFNATAMKILANIMVVVLNYVASKVWIFTKN